MSAVQVAARERWFVDALTHVRHPIRDDAVRATCGVDGRMRSSEMAARKADSDPPRHQAGESRLG
ncbi:hypothetical protein [Actinopolymorpha sp. B9G3]|uniref:hypothetical protein n=1 Tax=Actinopolymorpha sp. B9G3 TaxID=3158970 RepID=UPI0032D94794